MKENVEMKEKQQLKQLMIMTLSLPMLVIVKAFVLRYGWQVVMVKGFGLEPISLGLAVGIKLMFSAMYTINAKKDNEINALESVLNDLSSSIVQLIWFWVISLFI